VIEIRLHTMVANIIPRAAWASDAKRPVMPEAANMQNENGAVGVEFAKRWGSLGAGLSDRRGLGLVASWALAVRSHASLIAVSYRSVEGDG
jgi:hypothetical protein